MKRENVLIPKGGNNWERYLLEFNDKVKEDGDMRCQLAQHILLFGTIEGFIYEPF